MTPLRQAKAFSLAALILAILSIAGVALQAFIAANPSVHAVLAQSGSPAFKIIIIAGQSNAEGRALVLPEWREDDTGIYQLGRFGDTNWTIIPATEPLANWDPSGAAFAMTAVSHLREVEPGTYLIIPAAMGGTGFVDHEWTASTGPLYRDLIDRVRYVLARYPRSSVRAIFWHQGESEWIESWFGYNAAFPAELTAMIKQLYTDVPLGNAPFIVGGLVPAFEAKVSPKPSDVLRAVVARLPQACFVSAEGLVPMADGIHFEISSQKTLGLRYFEAARTCHASSD